MSANVPRTGSDLRCQSLYALIACSPTRVARSGIWQLLLRGTAARFPQHHARRGRWRPPQLDPGRRQQVLARGGIPSAGHGGSQQARVRGGCTCRHDVHASVVAPRGPSSSGDGISGLGGGGVLLAIETSLDERALPLMGALGSGARGPGPGHIAEILLLLKKGKRTGTV